jgi:hypothetical protein
MPTPILEAGVDQLEPMTPADYLVGVTHVLPANWQDKFRANVPHDELHDVFEAAAMDTADEMHNAFTPERLQVGFEMLAMGR